MGLDIMVFANHSLEGKTFKERIENIEIRLSEKIRLLPNRPYYKENEPTRTSNQDEVIYYFDNREVENFFGMTGEISIKTNYQFLREIRFFEQTMAIAPYGMTTDSYWWKRFLGGKDKPHPLNRFQYKVIWEKFQDFAFYLTGKLGGNKLVYIDDQSFQKPEDLFYQGKGFDEIIPELEKVGPLFDISILYDKFEEIDSNMDLTYFGFFKELQNNS
jgi:hypothetical protein